MAITAATKLSDFSGFLNPAQSAPIFERAAQQSVVQSLVRRVPLGLSGQTIPVVTGKPTAGWVGEGVAKPATQGTMAMLTMTPKKLAAIVVASTEVVRANPGDYVTAIRGQLAEAFAIAFDSATLHGTNSPFTNYVDQATKTRELGTATQAAGGIYGDIVAGLKLLVDDGQRLTGFAFDEVAEPLFLAATTTAGQPLFIDTPLTETTSVVRPGRLIGRPAYIGDGVASTTGSIVGYGGDWTQAAWGAIGGISYTLSTEATVTINGALVSLFENNLVAILAEAEYGWVMNTLDDSAEAVPQFVKYTNVTP